MGNLKVVKIDSDSLEFDNGVVLTSDHDQDCCEYHYLSFEDLTLEDFEDLEFDLSNDNFFQRVEGYGIHLKPVKGHSIPIPGYGYNNGYYSENLILVVKDPNNGTRTYDITECQVVCD
jgi:hypothetical protein